MIKSWLNGIFLGLLAIILLVACNNQPKVQTSPPVTRTSPTPLTELKLGVGSYFLTPDENRKQFEPLFKELAKQANLPAKITIAQDWNSIWKALTSGTLDVAWLRAWDYVLANNEDPSIQAIATVNYKKRPVHYAVLIARANAPFNTLDEAIAQSKRGKKLKLSLTDETSAPGWLIPQAEFKHRNLDPKKVFDYSEGTSEANQAIAVLNGQVDIASDYDRNLDVLASAKKVDTSKIKIIWQSVPLPNDAIVIRGGLTDDIKTKLKQALINFSPEQAKEFLPKNYTGFIASNGSNYASIQAAGALMGKLK